MNKKDREIVFDKYGGKCALCGCDLKDGWRIWDIIPIQTVVTESGSMEKINTDMNNLIPACNGCGSVRIKNESGKMDLEKFRKEIVEMYLFARNDAMYSSSIRRAIKFGLLIDTFKPVVFYFENQKLTHPPTGEQKL